MKRLVIDDIRVPNFPATVVRHVFEALKLIETESWDEVWLDHDMDLTKSPDVTWLTNTLEARAYTDGTIYPVGLFVLHSANTVGRKNMRAGLEKFYDVMDVEFYPDKSLALSGEHIVVDVSSEKGVQWNDDYRARATKWWNARLPDLPETGV